MTYYCFIRMFSSHWGRFEKFTICFICKSCTWKSLLHAKCFILWSTPYFAVKYIFSIPSVHSYYNPRIEESYVERGWQTQRDPVNRSTRSSTTAQPITTKKAPIRKTPRRPSPAKMSTMSSVSPIRSTSPTKSSRKLTPKTTPRKSTRKPYGDFVF